MRRALKTAQTAPYVQPPTGMQAARATPLRHGLPAGKPTGRKPPHSGGPGATACAATPCKGHAGTASRGHSLGHNQATRATPGGCATTGHSRDTHIAVRRHSPNSGRQPATAVAKRQHSGISSCSKSTYTIALAGVFHYPCHHLVCYLTAIDFEHLLKNGENNSHMGLRIQKF